MNRQISPELAQLWIHARSEYADIRNLEQDLERARRRHADLHEEIRQLIGSDAGSTPSADADRQAPTLPTPSGPVGGFSLHAFTPKGQAGLASIERLLEKLPHGDSL